jgi:hypothetical protein
MPCPHCEQDHPEGTLFCPITGKKIPQPQFCPACGKPVDPAWLHCGYCGQKIFRDTGMPGQQKTTATHSSQDPTPVPGVSKAGALSPNVLRLVIFFAVCGLCLVATIVFSIMRSKPSIKQSAAIAAPSWTPTAMPPTNPPVPVPTNPPVLEPTNPPTPAIETANANKAFAEGAVVYLYDLQPATINKSDLDGTKSEQESTGFSLRYILSKDARDLLNVLLIWKIDAQGNKEYIIPERKKDFLFEMGYVMDWANETGTITFSTFSRMADTSKEEGIDPNTALFTTWIISPDQIMPLYGAPNHHVSDPEYVEIVLISPEERPATPAPDSSNPLYNKMLLLSDSAKQLSNTLRIPVSP